MGLSYDDELERFIEGMEEEERAALYRREADLRLGKPFDALTDPEFLDYLHGRLSASLRESLGGRDGAAQVIALQLLYDVTRRRRVQGPDTADPDRYDLGGLEKLRGRPGLAE